MCLYLAISILFEWFYFSHIIQTKYFYCRCEANVEQAGSVTFDGETIEGAPPLWCAAAAGI